MSKKILKSWVYLTFILVIIGCSASFKELSTDINNKFIQKNKKIKLIRENNKQVVIDMNTKLMWQDNKSNIRKKWSDAKSHCNNLKFAEFSNWRLPRVKELLTITSNKINNLSVNQSCKNVFPKYYWSSDVYVPKLISSWPRNSKKVKRIIKDDMSQHVFAWLVNFKLGNDGSAYKSTPYYVMCVRDF